MCIIKNKKKKKKKKSAVFMKKLLYTTPHLKYTIISTVTIQLRKINCQKISAFLCIEIMHKILKNKIISASTVLRVSAFFAQTAVWTMNVKQTLKKIIKFKLLSLLYLYRYSLFRSTR